MDWEDQDKVKTIMDYGNFGYEIRENDKQININKTDTESY